MTYGTLTRWVYPYTGVMRIYEATAAAAASGNMIVQTRTGCQYRVYADTIENADDPLTRGYVYGERVNAPRLGPFSRGTGGNGEIRWFNLKNVRLVTA